MARIENQTVYSLDDAYPNSQYFKPQIEETSTAVVPNAEEQDAMGEANATQRNVVGQNVASTKKIFITLGVALAIVIFLGGVK